MAQENRKIIDASVQFYMYLLAKTEATVAWSIPWVLRMFWARLRRGRFFAGGPVLSGVKIKQIK
jgi:hypothetical protein